MDTTSGQLSTSQKSSYRVPKMSSRLSNAEGSSRTSCCQSELAGAGDGVCNMDAEVRCVPITVGHRAEPNGCGFWAAPPFPAHADTPAGPCGTLPVRTPPSQPRRCGVTRLEAAVAESAVKVLAWLLSRCCVGTCWRRFLPGFCGPAVTNCSQRRTKRRRIPSGGFSPSATTGWPFGGGEPGTKPTRSGSSAMYLRSLCPSGYSSRRSSRVAMSSFRPFATGTEWCTTSTRTWSRRFAVSDRAAPGRAIATATPSSPLPASAGMPRSTRSPTRYLWSTSPCLISRG